MERHLTGRHLVHIGIDKLVVPFDPTVEHYRTIERQLVVAEGTFEVTSRHKVHCSVVIIDIVNG